MERSRETGATSPFKFVADSRGRDVGWAVVCAPVYDRSHARHLAELSDAGYRFVGMTCYFDFPGPGVTDERDYGLLCEAWFHCFREPDRYLPPGAPAVRLCLSDFTDYRLLRPAGAGDRKVHDVVYVGARWDWKRKAKNWPLAARALPRICRELGVRALVVGEPDAELPMQPGVEFVPFLSWESFIDRLRQARALLVPNVVDPSPRVLAEALCLDVPIAVNRELLGGWHYVADATGTWFNDEHDAVAAVSDCLTVPRSPRRWYCSRFGPVRCGRLALRVLRSLDDSLAERSHVEITVDPPEGSPLLG
jgi:Glycosyl transferases group 1